MSVVEEKKSILLLDDDKFLLDMYSLKFSEHGYEVQAFLAADDALKALRSGFSPDAIVFDITMPVHDGVSFLATLQGEKMAENAIKIALTNQSGDIARESVADMGAKKFIVKATAIPSEVVTIVDDAIFKKRNTAI